MLVAAQEKHSEGLVVAVLLLCGEVGVCRALSEPTQKCRFHLMYLDRPCVKL